MSGKTFLALEDALVNRLKGELPDAVHVLTAADLAGVTEGTQPTPAVHVIFGASPIKRVNPDGRSAMVEQTWYTVITVRNVRGVRSGSDARLEASALVDKVLAALMGWKATVTDQPLMLTTPPAPGYSAGFLYLPLAWKAEVVLSNPPKN